jgi:hypothetical protein
MLGNDQGPLAAQAADDYWRNTAYQQARLLMLHCRHE